MSARSLMAALRHHGERQIQVQLLGGWRFCLTMGVELMWSTVGNCGFSRSAGMKMDVSEALRKNAHITFGMWALKSKQPTSVNGGFAKICKATIDILLPHVFHLPPTPSVDKYHELGKVNCLFLYTRMPMSRASPRLPCYGHPSLASEQKMASCRN